MVVGCAQGAVRVRAAAGWAHTWRSAVVAAWMAEVATSASIPLSLLERSVMVGVAWVTQRERWGGLLFRAERAAGAQVGRLPARGRRPAGPTARMHFPAVHLPRPGTSCERSRGVGMFAARCVATLATLRAFVRQASYSPPGNFTSKRGNKNFYKSRGGKKYGVPGPKGAHRDHRHTPPRPSLLTRPCRAPRRRLHQQGAAQLPDARDGRLSRTRALPLPSRTSTMHLSSHIHLARSHPIAAPAVRGTQRGALARATTRR